MSNEIRILDVIARRSPYSDKPHYYIVVDRYPVLVYEKKGNLLTAHDSGFYDFLGIEPGSKDAFAGREFEINLSDGSTYKCHGQVWSCGPSHGIEPVLSVGVGTIEGLRKCYVFSSSNVSKTKLEAWLAVNKPSGNYHKYDPTYTVEWLDSLYAKEQWDKPVCTQRARKLRKRGVTIRIDKNTGKRGWSPSYEKRKAEILRIQQEN